MLMGVPLNTTFIGLLNLLFVLTGEAVSVTITKSENEIE